MNTKSPFGTIILVHGLWMTGIELRWLGRHLERNGFIVRYFRYSSWRGTLDQAAAELRRCIEQQEGGEIHLLGHSLGGIVIAKMLEKGEPVNLGRIVLLGSPQQGSALATVLVRYRACRFFIGPVACEGIVRSRPASLEGREVLVVAGTLSLGFARLFGITASNDGTVVTSETLVPGARQILVRASHMGMLFSKNAATGICSFLKTPPCNINSSHKTSIFPVCLLCSAPLRKHFLTKSRVLLIIRGANY